MIHIEIRDCDRFGVETLEAIDIGVDGEGDASKRQQADGGLRICVGRSRQMQGFGFADSGGGNEIVKVRLFSIQDRKRNTE